MHSDRVSEAARVVSEGGVLLYPTATVYGLGGDPNVPAVLERIRALKGRDADKPMLVLTDEWARAEHWIANVTPLHNRLMAFDGPLTILFDASPDVPAALRGGSPLIGIRRTRDAFCRAVITQSGRLLCSTSANKAGDPSPATFSTIHPDLLARVDLAVDAGSPLGGAPSTVAGLRDGSLVIYRAGAVSEEELAAWLESG
ncbi:MAG: L-threonylcarbamoyladenylate synthase [Bacteroidota bacterium]